MKRRIMLAFVPLVLAGCGYNQIQQKDETAAQAKQQISVQLQRRADLVPNLVSTVKGYAQHEEANRIATSRQDYNQAVADYNAYIRKFPQTITAKVTGAKPRTYYEAAPGSETAPTVDFGTRPSGGATTPAAPRTP